MPISIVAGNWKMNTNVAEAVVLAAEIRESLDAIKGVKKIVCPPFISLMAVRSLLDNSSISIGAQNMYQEEKGAYTGEISPYMLANLCEYVILGHSERRQHFGETDQSVNLKVKAALKANLKPIICVGELLSAREKGVAEEVVTKQLLTGLEEIESLQSVTIAYEPVWAIGTGIAATPEDAEAMMAHIRSTLNIKYGDATSQEVPLLYGGSVTASNIDDYAKLPNINGALVGGASLNAEAFVSIASHLGAMP